MALKSYILTRDFDSPDVINTASTYKPAQIKMRRFRRGEIINGELKHANNQPAFVLVEGRLVFPLEVLKEVITREINSNASGEETKKAEDKKPAIVVTNSRMKSIDALLIGAVVGFAGVILAEKQGWITTPDKKNKFYGAGVGAVLGIYIANRFKK